jgi:hypothetical protein
VVAAELCCQLYPGQFSSEFAVIVESFNGRSYSLFAPREDVKHDREPSQDEPTEGWLRIKVLQREGNNVLVQLPQSTLENGSYLSVRRDQLRFSPAVASV